MLPAVSSGVDSVLPPGNLPCPWRERLGGGTEVGGGMLNAASLRQAWRQAIAPLLLEAEQGLGPRGPVFHLLRSAW